MSDTTFAETLIQQSARESIPYTIDTTPYGGSPAQISAIVVDLFTDEDITATVMPGTPSVGSNTITLPELSGLTAGHRYRLSVVFRTSSALWAPSVIIEATP